MLSYLGSIWNFIKNIPHTTIVKSIKSCFSSVANYLSGTKVVATTAFISGALWHIPTIAYIKQNPNTSLFLGFITGALTATSASLILYGASFIIPVCINFPLCFGIFFTISSCYRLLSWFNIVKNPDDKQNNSDE